MIDRYLDLLFAVLLTIATVTLLLVTVMMGVLVVRMLGGSM